MFACCLSLISSFQRAIWTMSYYWVAYWSLPRSGICCFNSRDDALPGMSSFYLLLSYFCASANFFALFWDALNSKRCWSTCWSHLQKWMSRGKLTRKLESVPRDTFEPIVLSEIESSQSDISFTLCSRSSAFQRYHGTHMTETGCHLKRCVKQTFGESSVKVRGASWLTILKQTPKCFILTFFFLLYETLHVKGTQCNFM